MPAFLQKGGITGMENSFRFKVKVVERAYLLWLAGLLKYSSVRLL